jgi:hypothetical protein
MIQLEPGKDFHAFFLYSLSRCVPGDAAGIFAKLAGFSISRF